MQKFKSCLKPKWIKCLITITCSHFLTVSQWKLSGQLGMSTKSFSHRCCSLSLHRVWLMDRTVYFAYYIPYRNHTSSLHYSMNKERVKVHLFIFLSCAILKRTLEFKFIKMFWTVNCQRCLFPTEIVVLSPQSMDYGQKFPLICYIVIFYIAKNNKFIMKKR